MTEQEKEILEEEAVSAGCEDCTADSGVPDSVECMADSGAPDSEECDAEEEAAGASEAEEETPEENPEGEEKKSWAEKRAAKKQAKADKKEDAYKEQIAQLEDKVKRQLAEFENFRNRTEKEKQAMFEVGAKSVIEKILPVVDNFERGFQTVDPEDADDAFVEGMNKVYRQLMTELDNLGVKPIEAVGHEFDPNLHNAVMQCESEEYESGVVAQELLKGYTYRDSVVRHSMVSVTI